MSEFGLFVLCFFMKWSTDILVNLKSAYLGLKVVAPFYFWNIFNFGYIFYYFLSGFVRSRTKKKFDNSFSTRLIISLINALALSKYYFSFLCADAKVSNWRVRLRLNFSDSIIIPMYDSVDKLSVIIVASLPCRSGGEAWTEMRLPALLYSKKNKTKRLV